MSRFLAAAAAAPIVFALLWFAGTRERISTFPGSKPLVLVPYVGLALTPLLATIATALWRTGSRVARLAAALGAWYCLVHLVFSTIYGNVNNDAHSHSWMVDVAVPPAWLDALKHLPPDMAASRDPVDWYKNAVDGPHTSPLAAFPTCQRGFMRFMIHEVLPSARLSKLTGSGALFGGLWVAVEGSASKSGRPVGLYTDFAGGNEVKFNKVVLPKFLVDTRNGFFDGLRFPGPPFAFDQPFYEGGVTFNATAVDWGQRPYDPSPVFLMSQYSCMTEVEWLYRLTGVRACFQKTMAAQDVQPLEGVLDIPGLLPEPVRFPSPAGFGSDCARPIAHAVKANYLHWTRDNVRC